MTNVAMTPAAVTGIVDWANVGGASALASITDALDTSYLTDTGATSPVKTFTVSWTNPSLPDGAAIQQFVVTVRNSQVTYAAAYDYVVGLSYYGGVSQGGNGTLPNTSGIGNDTIYTGSYNAPSPTPASIAAGITTTIYSSGPASTVSPTAGNDSSANDHRIYKISGVMSYIAAPTATALAVVAGDLTTTTKPTHTYTYTSPDGVAQYELQAASWVVSDLANYPGGQAAFDADADAAFRDAAGVGCPSFIAIGTTYTAKGWTVDPDTGVAGRTRPAAVAAGGAATWVPTQPLPAAAAMKSYLRPSGLYANNRLTRTNNAASGGVATVSFTMAVPVPPVATSIVANWSASPVYVMTVTVALPVHTTTRRVFIEHSADGGFTWYLLPYGSQVFPAAAGSAVFYDPIASPGRAMRYRVRSAQPVLESYSAYTTTATGTVAAFNAFVLRDPLDIAQTSSVLRILGDLDETADEILGENRGLGASLPSIISDAIGGRRWSLEVLLVGEAEYAALRALRAKRVTMMFQTDMLGYWHWVRFGDAWSVTTIRQTQRVAEATRTRRVRFSLIETFPVAGQPTPAELKG